MPAKRLFVGTFLADEQKDKLAQLLAHKAELQAWWQCQLRPVKPAKLHQTWFFLGAVECALIPSIVALLSHIARNCRQGEIIYEKLEFWPSDRRPRQLVAVAKLVPEPMRILQANIRAGLYAYAAKPDERPFKPHITLARLSRTAAATRQALRLPGWLDVTQHLPLVFNVSQIDLIESGLGARGRYETIDSFPLIQ